MSLYPLLSSLLLVGVTTLLLLVLRAGGKKKNKLPPGPWGLPIIGHLLHMSRRPYRDMCRLSRTYGPVMRLNIGSFPAVVVSSPAAAQEMFRYHDLATVGRPVTQTSEVLFHRGSSLSITQYGPYWRAMRKLFTSEFFSGQKVESFAPIRQEEVGHLMADLRSAGAGSVVDVTAKLSSLLLDVTCRLVLGSHSIPGMGPKEMRDFRMHVKDGVILMATINIVDFFPVLKRLDPQGFGRRMWENKRALKPFVTKIAERMDAGPQPGQHKSLIDALVSYRKDRPDDEKEIPFDDQHVKALVMEIISTSVETTTTTAEWAFVELLKHPEIMKKAQQELTNVVGLDRMVKESDLANLPFLEMVLKETLRLHAPLPLLIPHVALEDFTLQGFYIEQGTQIFINVWAIGRDPTLWPDPEKFWPERFLDLKVDYKGHDFQFIPFGSGRRICAGMQLGVAMVRLVLAQLVHCFNWELPDGISADKLNMEESYNITAPRGERLLAIPKYRLN